MIKRKDIHTTLPAPTHRGDMALRAACHHLRSRNLQNRASSGLLGAILFLVAILQFPLCAFAQESSLLSPPGADSIPSGKAQLLDIILKKDNISREAGDLAPPDSIATENSLFDDESDYITFNAKELSPLKPYFHSVNEGCNCKCIESACWADAKGNPVSRRILLKSNIPAWGMLWANLAAEIDIVPHWSFELPVYWSPFNYGTRTLKFRTFSIIPKFRYWLSKNNDGFFFDFHAGFAYYNIAIGKDKRYQDHKGERPALGGGLGIGYRFRLPNPHWKIELAAGAGVYSLDYDIFENTKNGLIQSRRKRAFFGLDNFAVSVSYEFYVRPRNKEKLKKAAAILQDDSLQEGGGL